jgi:hypothetical protein
MIRIAARTAAIALVWLVASGHVGSPDVWFQGLAGPYQIVVQVTPAPVVPGVAVVNVRVPDGQGTSVSLSTTRFDATGGAPPPEAAVKSVTDPELFTGKLWIMAGGSNSVIVNVTGAKGAGSVVVPVVAVPLSRLDLQTPMAAGLAAAGVFLFVGLITIVGAAVRESALPAGEAPGLERRRNARKWMMVTSLFVGVALVAGWKWWDVEDESFNRSIYKPFTARAAVDGGQLRLAITDSTWLHRNDSAWLRSRDASAWSPLVEDHGKLMHLFAVRDDMSAFAHLHPETTDTATFAAMFPALPAGTYRIYGDVVHESGFAQTVVTDATVGSPASSPVAVGNPDDSWFVGTVAKSASEYVLEDGSKIRWRHRPASVTARTPVAFTFDLVNADGTAAALEPYMGMAAHAVVYRNDGSVFVHLHPMGTVSVASQMTFTMRQPGDTVRGTLGRRVSEMAVMDHAQTIAGPVTFPYAFPKPGEYRIWVQLKRGGSIVTGAFDASVADSPPAR